MRRTRTTLAMLVLLLAADVSATWADDRAEWGVVVTIGDDIGAGLLLEKQGRFSVVALDPLTPIRGANLSPMTWTDLRPGDRVDYAVSVWAGMDIAELIHVTPQPRTAAVR